MNIIKKFFLTLLVFLFLPLFANNNIKINLTQEEREWIRENPIIKVANQMDWQPFDFVKDDIPSGFNIDHIRLIAKRAGLKIKFINGYTWKELNELFINKKIDIMPGYFIIKKRKEFTLFSKPFLEGKIGVFSIGEIEYTKKDLPKLRVGVETGDAGGDIAKKDILGLKLIDVDSPASLVRQLATNKLDAIIASPLTIYYNARQQEINNINFVDYIKPLNKKEKSFFHLGVRNDYHILQSIVNKSLSTITKQEYDDLYDKWTAVNVNQKFDWTSIAEVIFLVLVLIVFLFIYNGHLRFKVAEKTQSLQELNDKLEKEVDKRTKELREANKQLEMQSNTDTLTNIYNRRYFFTVSEKTFSLYKRDKNTFSLAMIDVDNFKNVNDTYGHDVGDIILKFLAKKVTEVIRVSDVFVRFGGEEFLILFPNTEIDGAVNVCEKIRAKIETMEYQNINTTISIGVTESFESDESITDVIKRADELLYKAKDSGRNQVYN